MIVTAGSPIGKFPMETFQSVEGLLASFVLPNKHLLHDEQFELVPSLGGSHLRFEGNYTAAHTSGDASKDTLLDVVRSLDALNEAEEVVDGPLGSLLLLVGEEVEMLRDDEVRGLVLCPHHHGSHVVALRPLRLLPCSESMLVLPLARRWAY